MNIIAPIVYLIFYVFFCIAYVVAWIGASVINMTLNPAIINSVLNIDPKMPLYQGWTIFRDIANLFFHTDFAVYRPWHDCPQSEL